MNDQGELRKLFILLCALVEMKIYEEMAKKVKSFCLPLPDNVLPMAKQHLCVIHFNGLTFKAKRLFARLLQQRRLV